MESLDKSNTVPHGMYPFQNSEQYPSNSMGFKNNMQESSFITPGNQFGFNQYSQTNASTTGFTPTPMDNFNIQNSFMNFNTPGQSFNFTPGINETSTVVNQPAPPAVTEKFSFENYHFNDYNILNSELFPQQPAQMNMNTDWRNPLELNMTENRLNPFNLNVINNENTQNTTPTVHVNNPFMNYTNFKPQTTFPKIDPVIENYLENADKEFKFHVKAEPVQSNSIFGTHPKVNLNTYSLKDIELVNQIKSIFNTVYGKRNEYEWKGEVPLKDKPNEKKEYSFKFTVPTSLCPIKPFIKSIFDMKTNEPMEDLYLHPIFKFDREIYTPIFILQNIDILPPNFLLYKLKGDFYPIYKEALDKFFYLNKTPQNDIETIINGLKRFANTDMKDLIGTAQQCNNYEYILNLLNNRNSQTIQAAQGNGGKKDKRPKPNDNPNQGGDNNNPPNPNGDGNRDPKDDSMGGSDNNGGDGGDGDGNNVFSFVTDEHNPNSNLEFFNFTYEYRVGQADFSFIPGTDCLLKQYEINMFHPANYVESLITAVKCGDLSIIPTEEFKDARKKHFFVLIRLKPPILKNLFKLCDPLWFWQTLNIKYAEDYKARDKSKKGNYNEYIYIYSLDLYKGCYYAIITMLATSEIHSTIPNILEMLPELNSDDYQKEKIKKETVDEKQQKDNKDAKDQDNVSMKSVSIDSLDDNSGKKKLEEFEHWFDQEEQNIQFLTFNETKHLNNVNTIILQQILLAKSYLMIHNKIPASWPLDRLDILKRIVITYEYINTIMDKPVIAREIIMQTLDDIENYINTPDVINVGNSQQSNIDQNGGRQ